MPGSTPDTLGGMVAHLIDIINLVIPFLMTVAFLVIVWRLVDAWVINAGDPGKQQEGKTVLLVGVVVMAIIVSIWGILALLRNGLFG